MPRIIIDGREVECRPGIPVLQAALEAGLDIPHYCYHPGLRVVASCRLCLMEMKMPHPRTQEPVWAPKLVPSCQTPVRDGLEVRFNSEAVRQNHRHVMEYYLLNHPLDCPVCDKAGECYLQDYTEQFGPAASRMLEEKTKNPKKDIGPHTLLYQDRCVLCTRCVRFTEEITGTGELTVVNRGNRGEIDVFPGRPLDNPLQGNVVDLCPVGALLDKDFLFKQRVWLLRSTKSVSPADSRGQTIWIDHNEGRIYRIRPRFNERVNEWWISDEARFGWKFVHADSRLRYPSVRGRGPADPAQPLAGRVPLAWEDVPARVRAILGEAGARDGGARVAAVLSPMMSCEEAWLLASLVREMAPAATLVPGFVPVVGRDQIFPKGFVIKAEKCPNRRGVETILAYFGGPQAGWNDFLGRAVEGAFEAAYVVGGYPDPGWVTPAVAAALARIDGCILHDLFPSAAAASAAVLLPAASWAEREGTFMNCDGLVQAFERALPPLEGVKADGQVLYELAGRAGLFRSETVRGETAAAVPALGAVFVPRDLPPHAH